MRLVHSSENGSEIANDFRWVATVDIDILAPVLDLVQERFDDVVLDSRSATDNRILVRMYDGTAGPDPMLYLAASQE